ncbi:rod shape-determining protein MreC [bacterium]|nr:rod shape-determining protein MreC [bacterium]
MFGTLKPYLPWLGTSLIALLLILSNDNQQVKALRGNFSDLIVVGTSPFSSVLKAPRLWNENIRLHKRLSEMSIMLADLSSSGEECQRLRRMLDLREKSEYRLIVAEVVGINPDMGVRGMLLNVGRDDGVKINHTVIIPDGVVGRIYRVGKSSSAVQLLLDPNIGIAGRLVSNREDGIVHAAGGRKLKLDGIPITVKVSMGDSVITSGLGGLFPPGLLIGYTSRVQHSASDWLWEVIIDPAVNFGSLDELFVILKSDNAE